MGSGVREMRYFMEYDRGETWTNAELVKSWIKQTGIKRNRAKPLLAAFDAVNFDRDFNAAYKETHRVEDANWERWKELAREKLLEKNFSIVAVKFSKKIDRLADLDLKPIRSFSIPTLPDDVDENILKEFLAVPVYNFTQSNKVIKRFGFRDSKPIGYAVVPASMKDRLSIVAVNITPFNKPSPGEPTHFLEFADLFTSGRGGLRRIGNALAKGGALSSVVRMLPKFQQKLSSGAVSAIEEWVNKQQSAGDSAEADLPSWVAVKAIDSGFLDWLFSKWTAKEGRRGRAYYWRGKKTSLVRDEALYGMKNVLAMLAKQGIFNEKQLMQGLRKGKRYHQSPVKSLFNAAKDALNYSGYFKEAG